MKFKKNKVFFMSGIIILSIIILGFLFYLMAPRLVKSTLDASTPEQRFEKLNRAQREVIGNVKFSEDDINNAMDIVLENISQYKGVGVNKIFYDKTESNNRLNNAFEINSDKYIVIGVNENNNTYTGNGDLTTIWYYLIKDSSNNWIVTDFGKP